MLFRTVLLGAFAGLMAASCDNGPATLAQPPGSVGDGGLADQTTLGQGVGQPCNDAQRCRVGLQCTSGKCEPAHSSDDGTPCQISAECKRGSYCGPERKCAPAGAGGDGASCASDADCQSGLRCNLVGLGAQCKPEGTGDLGAACTTSADCFGGLACANKQCVALPPGKVPPLGLPSWQGVECKDDPAGTPATAYFRVPRGTPDDGDFFRLPFPNDARRRADGHPNLTGFPTPGAELLGYDIVDRYARDVEQNADGFSVYPTIIARFNTAVDFNSLKTAGALRFVDVTQGAGGGDLGFAWTATTGRSPYVCPNAIYVRPPLGAPLKPGSTYAFFATNAVFAAGGGAISRSPDLSALIANAAPADPALAAAYTAYKPLRDWAASKSFDLATLVTATVFTVGKATDPASKLAPAVASAAPPSATGWVKCPAASPCPQAQGDRACGADNAAFDEYQALVSLPIFQKGSAPYEKPADGGDLVYDASGIPQVQRTEQVCLSLTVPKSVTSGAVPLVIYAHGTGGSYRSHVTEGIAERLASVDGVDRMAVLGIDQVQHGPRRGSSQASPNDLFFNFANPGAARGNPLQGAADQMALVRFAQSLSLPTSLTGASGAITFGPLAFWGHSQGATAGAIAMPYTQNVTAAVLSGVGASLIDALLTKTSPVNVAAAVPAVLVDPGVSGLHPVLTLLQNAIDPADPLSHARALAAAPLSQPGKHVLVPYGQRDTYSPSTVQITYVVAGGLGVATPPPSVTSPDSINGITPTQTPAGPNLDSNRLAGYLRQYTPNNYDGHFVAFRDADAQRDIGRFLADATATPARTVRVGR
jgi:hypothetical protein